MLGEKGLCGISNRKHSHAEAGIQLEIIRNYYASIGTLAEIEKHTIRIEQVKTPNNHLQKRRIKSTLQTPVSCSTTKITNIITQITPITTQVTPIGYKQKSNKSEKIDINTFYDSWAWKDLRLQVLQKYGRRCQCCGAKPEKTNKVVINVDHIKPLRNYPELALDINNLQVLCSDCNMGKGYWNTTDFRDAQ